MTHDPNQGAPNPSGPFSRANIAEFVGRWSGGLLGDLGQTQASPPLPQLEPAQAQAVNDSMNAASSWSVSFAGLDVSLRNAYQLVTYPLPSLEQIRYILDEVHGMDMDDVDAEEVFRNPDLSLQGVHTENDAGDKVDIEGILAQGVDLQLVSAITQGRGMVTIDCLRVQKLAYSSELIEVEASLVINQIELKATTEALVAALRKAYALYNANADAELGIFDPGEHAGLLKRYTAGFLAAITANLRVEGISIGGIDGKIDVKKFGMAEDEPPATITSKEGTLGAMVAGFCRDLDITIDQIRIQLEAEDTPLGEVGARLAVQDTNLKIGRDGTGVAIEGGTKVHLGGAAKVNMGGITGNIAVVAVATADLGLGKLTVDRVEAGVTVKGYYAEYPVNLDMTLTLNGVSLEISTDRGTFVNCIAQQSMLAIQTAFVWVIGDGGPTGMKPGETQKIISAMILAELNEALLKTLTVTFNAKIGHLDARINSFAFGEFSGEGDMDVRGLDFEATIAPDEAVEMRLTASVLMSGLLRDREKNLLDFKNIDVELDESGSGKMTGEFQLHSSGLDEVLGGFLAQISKLPRKDGKIDLKIVNYTVDLNSANVALNSSLLSPLTSAVLKHVGVSGGDKPSLALVGGKLRKVVSAVSKVPGLKKLKKLTEGVSSEALGQREEQDAGEILIDSSTAQAIFENEKSRGAVNLLAFVQNNLQTWLDNLKAYEPDESLLDPDALPRPPAPTVKDVPLMNDKQIKAATKLDEARKAMQEALKTSQDAPDDKEKKDTLLDAIDKRDKAESKLMAENQKVIDKEMKKLFDAAVVGTKTAIGLAKAAAKKSGKSDPQQRYEAEVRAAHDLLVNNCLIDAIARAGRRGPPTIPELVAIRTQLNNVGQMMLATPANITLIRQALNLAGRRVVVSYPAPIPPEIFDGSEPTIYVRHNGSAHFIADDG